MVTTGSKTPDFFGWRKLKLPACIVGAEGVQMNVSVDKPCPPRNSAIIWNLYGSDPPLPIFHHGKTLATNLPVRGKGPEQREVVLEGENKLAETTESASVGVGPASSYVGSPLLWVGVGVGISALFSFAANSVKRYAMQQMFKTMVGQSIPGSSPFGNMPMPPGAGFPFPVPPPGVVPTAPVSAAAAAPPVDVAPTSVMPSQPTPNSEAFAPPPEPRKPAFTDINASVVMEQQQRAVAAKSAAEQTPPTPDPKGSLFTNPEVVDSRGWSSSGAGASSNDAAGKAAGGTLFTVDALERMMEDPTVQKMVYPYLPEEMRNPATFKWMMQNPQYRQQLQDMLNSMGGDGAWDSRMSDMLKNFDLNSHEVKQQFEQIGLTPEEGSS